MSSSRLRTPSFDGGFWSRQTGPGRSEIREKLYVRKRSRKRGTETLSTDGRLTLNYSPYD